MRIAFDLDCVCINTTERLVEYINERLPVNLRMEDITTYSIEAALPEQYQWIVEAGFRDSIMWKGVKVLPFCPEVIDQLYNEGHEIFFATSSLPQNLRKKINHLARNLHLPEGYVERHTINIRDKYLLNVDVLVDDCADHITHPKKKYYGIVLDYPWNRGEDVDNTPCTTRAFGWCSILEKIHMIERLLKENDNDDVSP